ncbi:TPA: hypothetical protein DD449_05185 [Candidatus Berkelbacteria bacterium]|uniref:Uncharacterized protein n=1 Tax=Berkelbacteria bacterium GW2011_GWE1_39_12 TaxID=1618337 RepID=A0A0G4B4C1_9BACT|nr:MAG: hypothetical protein UT28_C0001G0655 [Berkelbacteria bacterium GW2011_GWE1_39_12]HBO61047.1 hypothetical protein [Candidatus Berkelbacteria bacterium]
MGEILNESVGQITTKTLSDVEPTAFCSSTIILNPEHLREVVEEPLIPACEILYQKNIETADSSANNKDIRSGGDARICINWDSLSEENRKIVEGLGLEPVPFNNFQVVILQEPIEEKTTVQELSNKFTEKANMFLLQEPKWIPSFTMDDLRKEYGYSESDESTPEDFEQDYYDQESKRFYLSEDHYRKVKEWEDSQVK